ncbi:MAG: acetoin utilization protein AcuC [Steroidobacteraceae bacterium]
MTSTPVLVIADDALGHYGFPDPHPFGTDRLAAFQREFRARGLAQRTYGGESRAATDTELRRFHSEKYLQHVRDRSRAGTGYLDGGDTPAYRGVYETSAQVVGATLHGCERIMAGEHQRVFIPIAGLHHAARGHAAGFCVFNDIGVAVETLRSEHGLKRIAYVDIDAHHGDGVQYAFEEDPMLIFADLHEDGAHLYPGTGNADETGKGAAVGTKLNIPLPPATDDAGFAAVWPRALQHIRGFEPEFILFQCGADSLGGDPIAHLRLTAASHVRAARDLCGLANELGHGRVLGMGGGGYNRDNLAAAWNGVVEAFVAA